VVIDRRGPCAYALAKASRTQTNNAQPYLALRYSGRSQVTCAPLCAGDSRLIAQPFSKLACSTAQTNNAQPELAHHYLKLGHFEVMDGE
jgi:hypothetical protein